MLSCCGLSKFSTETPLLVCIFCSKALACEKPKASPNPYNKVPQSSQECLPTLSKVNAGLVAHANFTTIRHNKS
eukprot:4378699-Amphidinium_carterae.2